MELYVLIFFTGEIEQKCDYYNLSYFEPLSVYSDIDASAK